MYPVSVFAKTTRTNWYLWGRTMWVLFEKSPHTPKNFYNLGFTSRFVFFSLRREEKNRAKPIMEKESELSFSMIVLALTENLHRDFLSQNDVKFSKTHATKVLVKLLGKLAGSKGRALGVPFGVPLVPPTNQNLKEISKNQAFLGCFWFYTCKKHQKNESQRFFCCKMLVQNAEIVSGLGKN